MGEWGKKQGIIKRFQKIPHELIVKLCFCFQDQKIFPPRGRGKSRGMKLVVMAILHLPGIACRGGKTQEIQCFTHLKKFFQGPRINSMDGAAGFQCAPEVEKRVP